MSDQIRYFVDQDHDCHWYIVPSHREDEWNAWLAIPSDDERSWDVPEWATEVGGAPNRVTFIDPVNGSTPTPPPSETAKGDER